MVDGDCAMADVQSNPLVELQDVSLHYPVRGGIMNRPKAWVRAVDGVTLSVEAGDALGLVGESGCGKTTLVNGILGLDRPTHGCVLLDGHDLAIMRGGRLRHLRRQMQVVFQDPFWSLNPRWLVRDIVSEPLRVHEHLNARETLRRVTALLATVGLSEDALFKYPHEFSAGARQRIALARALALNPRLLVLDEPTSAIDVLSQHQILRMLDDLKERMHLTFILVSHDLSVVAYLATHIAVMYLGKVVEYGRTEQVFETPVHPYTRALFAAVPSPSMRGVSELVSLQGEVPSALQPPAGCRFHTRCPVSVDRCRHDEPGNTTVSPGHVAACWLLEESLTSTGGAERLAVSNV